MHPYDDDADDMMKSMVMLIVRLSDVVTIVANLSKILHLIRLIVSANLRTLKCQPPTWEVVERSRCAQEERLHQAPPFICKVLEATEALLVWPSDMR